MKSNHGASASGVYHKFLFRGYKKNKKVFKKVSCLKEILESLKGSVYFQKYLKGLKEWRMVRW